MLLITARKKRLLSKMDLQPMSTLANCVYSIIYILHTHTHTHTYIYIYYKELNDLYSLFG